MSVEELTAEIESLSQQIMLLENRRREATWKRNRVLAESASLSEQPRKGERHVGGVKQ
jgi:hypothetical protein